MTNMYPSGKGMFIWQIKRVFGGDPGLIADRAVALGLSWVAIKLAGGTGRYNLRWTGIWYVDDIVQPLVDALRERGVLVYGWHYMYLRNGVGEANRAIERIGKFDLDGWLMDPEREAKHRDAEAWKFAGRLAAEYWDDELGGMGFPVGLCSYRYPIMHPELSWEALVSVASFHAPQVYWQGSHNPAYQLEQSHDELMEIKALPFVPAGSAYNEHGWVPLKRELDEFDAKAQAMGMPGVIWWEWAEAIENGFEDTIAGHEWGGEPVLPTPPPIPDPEYGELVTWLEELGVRLDELDTRLDGSGARMEELGTRVDAMATAVADLVERVGALEDAPPPDPETMRVIVTADKLRVETICGYDAACGGYLPPGKPVMAPDGDVVRYNKDEAIVVRARPQIFSCKDDPKTASIKASGGKLYYRIAEGRGAGARFNERYPEGAYVDAAKVRG